jgi:hypothetical protein
LWAKLDAFIDQSVLDSTSHLTLNEKAAVFNRDLGLGKLISKGRLAYYFKARKIRYKTFRAAKVSHS